MKKGILTGIKFKAAAIVATSLCMLNHEAKASAVLESTDPISRYFTKKKRKPKLVLKLNMYDPVKSYFVDHSSHSSHESHSSHSSGGYDGNSSDSGSSAPVVIGIAAIAGYGLYRLGKKNGGSSNK